MDEVRAVDSISIKKCASCNGEMSSIGVRKIQLGQTGFILGDLPNLIAGALEVEILTCVECGKIEFYQASFTDDSEDSIEKMKCPKCGKLHDIDYPKCPFCRHNYNTD